MADPEGYVAPGSPVYTEVHDSLARMGLVSADQPIVMQPMSGGVSSDIWRVDAPPATFCVKRALARLKVAADWQAPVSRNRYEVAYFRTVAGIVPGSVPEVLGDDEFAGAFAMTYLPPERYPVWKALLRDGTVDPDAARAVGEVLGRIHAATADRPDVAAAFATDAVFHAIRLEPYLEATARAHPALAGALADLVARTASTRRVLVHGDFSPKNLLIGPDGPVVLDAECAWFGDPAFDLAFVLNHLLLKGAWQPRHLERYLDAYAALAAGYRAYVRWEPWRDLERRVAALVPALMLARIDGKSPVEYLTDEADRDAVRAFAIPRVKRSPATLHAVASAWARR